MQVTIVNILLGFLFIALDSTGHLLNPSSDWAVNSLISNRLFACSTFALCVANLASCRLRSLKLDQVIRHFVKHGVQENCDEVSGLREVSSIKWPLFCGVTWVLLTYWSCARRQTSLLKMLWGSGPKEKYLTMAYTT